MTKWGKNGKEKLTFRLKNGNLCLFPVAWHRSIVPEHRQWIENKKWEKNEDLRKLRREFVGMGNMCLVLNSWIVFPFYWTERDHKLIFIFYFTNSLYIYIYIIWNLNLIQQIRAELTLEIGPWRCPFKYTKGHLHSCTDIMISKCENNLFF